MKKLILVSILFFSNIYCLSQQTLEQTSKMNEEKRLMECTKNIEIVEPNNTTREYKIINAIMVTINNTSNKSIFDYLKREACKKRGDALLFPEIERGPINTTYTSKVIVWKKTAKSPEPTSKMNEENQGLIECTRNMEIVELNNATIKYKIIDVIIITINNTNNKDIFDYLKTEACKKGGDALLFPEIERGPINTTYTSKVIVWKQSVQ